MFLTLMVIGLVGLAMMAIPGLFRHGGASHAMARGGSVGHAPHTLGLHAPRGAGRAETDLIPADVAAKPLRLIPSPRGVFTALALFGAFGNAAEDLFHVSPLVATIAALGPTWVVERFAVRPLWNLVFRFRGSPLTPLDALVFGEAIAVVPFRNGRGVVSTVRDGRAVQLSATLCDAEASFPVKVGDRLRIESVDGRHERVTVSVLRGEEEIA